MLQREQREESTAQHELDCQLSGTMSSHKMMKRIVVW